MKVFTIEEVRSRVKGENQTSFPAIIGRVAMVGQFKDGQYGRSQEITLIDDAGNKLKGYNSSDKFDFARAEGKTVILAHPRHKKATHESVKVTYKKDGDREYFNLKVNGFVEVWDANTQTGIKVDRGASFDFTDVPTLFGGETKAPQTRQNPPGPPTGNGNGNGLDLQELKPLPAPAPKISTEDIRTAYVAAATGSLPELRSLQADCVAAAIQDLSQFDDGSGSILAGAGSLAAAYFQGTLAAGASQFIEGNKRSARY